MNKRSTPSRSNKRAIQQDQKTEEAVAADPFYRRAKNIAGVAGLIGVAWIAIQATKHWFSEKDA